MRYKQRKLLEQNLTSLENYIQQNNLDITPEYMIHCITEADPDQHQFKNSKWLIKNLLDQNFLWEDIESGNESKAFDTLSRFLNIRKQWPESNLRDINQYVGLSGIAEKIRPFEITKGMNELKREEKAKIYENTIVLYDKNDYLVVIPKTQEASCFWGRNTEWCTASTQSANYFDDYNKDAPLIICITPDNKKYQFHKDSEPMDENDKELKNITDPILVQLAVLTGVLQWVPNYLKTLELCELAVSNDGEALQFVPEIFQNTNIYKVGIQQNGEALYYIPEELRTKELCELAVTQNGNALGYVPEEFKTKELCEIAINQNGYALIFIPKELKTKELCELAIKQNGCALLWVPDNFKTKEFCELAVKQNGEALSDVPQELKTKEICELAVQQDALSLGYVPEKLKTKELCELAIKYGDLVLGYIPEESRTKDICELAVRQNGMSLEYVSEELITPEICELAVQQNGEALSYVPDKFRTKELCELAEQQFKNMIKPMPEWLENKEYEILQNHLDNFILPDNKLSVSLNYA